MLQVHTHHRHTGAHTRIERTGDTLVATLTVGIKPATRYAGVCVGIDGVPLEAVTIEADLAVPKAALGTNGKALPGNSVALVSTPILAGLAADTVRTARDILTDHAATIEAACGPNVQPVWCVETLVPGRRSSVATGRRLEAVIAQSRNEGALAALLADENVQWVPTPALDAYTTYPASLSGVKPRAWRGRRKSGRAQQRAAWAISQAGLAARGHHFEAPESTMAAPVAPVSPMAPAPTVPVPAAFAEYITALRGLVRNSQPTTVDDLMTAARNALAEVPAPAGGRALTSDEVAYDALIRVGVAPHLDPEPIRQRLQRGVSQ